MRRLLLPIVMLVTAKALAAQTVLRGSVRDSATAQPVPGAVVMLRDAAGATLVRTITGDRGEFALQLRPSAQQVHVLRIGFRPRDVTLTRGATQLDIALASVPLSLEAVRTVATNQCRARPDAGAAQALLEQARAGLLATVVARESNPATVTLLAFDRAIDASTDRIVRQKVRIAETARAVGSFNASHSAGDFVRDGFVLDSAGVQTFYGPDAEVLLDNAFSAAYCFGIARDAQHVNQLGLAFSPANRHDRRVDVEGTLWIDTVARALRTTEFRYVGFRNNVMEGFNPGGRVSFHEMPNGVTLIDGWSMRLVGAADTTREEKTGTVVRSGYALREVGGQLARAGWSDGRTWTANLPSVRIASATANALPAGAVIAFDSTDYRAAVDSTGVATISDVLPGPYEVSVVDPRLASLNILIPTALAFESKNDALNLRLTMPSADDYVAAACRAQSEPTGSTWLMGRVFGGDGKPLANAHWKLNALRGGNWQTVADGGITGSSGLFAFCHDLSIGDNYQVQVWREGESPEVFLRRATEHLTIVPVRLHTAIANAPLHDLHGTLADSATGAAIPDAQVTVAGAKARAVTDSAGRFTLRGVPLGEHTLEVRTWALDSLGAVSQSSVVFADTSQPVAIKLPPMSVFANAMCAVDSTARGKLLGDGVIVGSVDILGDTVVPPGVRIVAEWNEAVMVNGAMANKPHWVETRSDVRGAYRLCGVPTNTPVIVRAEAKDAAAEPRAMRIAAASHFARAEMTLDRNVRAAASFVGLVLTDSTRLPLGGAEVALPKISKRVVTNDRGSFRITDIPPGTHDVSVRHVGYGALNTSLTFAANQALERKILLGRSVVLEPFTVTASEEASASIPGFEENRKLGLGAFLTREDLSRQEGRRLSDVLEQMKGMGIFRGSADRAWVMSKRVAPSLPKCSNMTQSKINGINNGRMNNTCQVSTSDPGTGVYCPETIQEKQAGMQCGCFAEVYLDGSLMNRGHPTPPFDVNELMVGNIEAIEYYASPALTPMKYSQSSSCGVLVIWTRRSLGDTRSSSESSSRQ